VFQLEDSELTAELLPDADRLGRMLFIESAEGGAGVLRRLLDEPEKLREVATRALEIAHFDPTTGTDACRDLTDEADEVSGCVQACYDCLLSYTNQPDHRVIDRHRIVGHLRDLAAGTFDRPRRAPVVASEPAVPSGDVVAQFVAWLKDNGYRQPDAE